MEECKIMKQEVTSAENFLFYVTVNHLTVE